MNSPAGTSPVEHWTFQVDSPFRGPAEIRDLSGRAADEARGAGLGDMWLEAEDPFLMEFEQTDELEGYEEAETEGVEPAEAEAAVAEADLLEETPASEHPLAAVFSLPRLAFNAMAKGGWATAIAVAIGAGLRDVNKLTNMIFWFRHPQMIGQKIRPDQRDLAREWTDIRDGIVKPAFASAPAPTAPSSPPTPGPLGAGGRTSIPSDGLRWYGPGEATPELMAFMRKVYDLHVKRSRGDFVDTLPETALEEVESGKKARKDAARKAREMLAAARVALAAEGLTGTVRIGVLSAYRSADLQFDIWQGKTTKGKGGFPHYYQGTKSTRQHPRYGGEHSDKAAAYLAEYMALYVAAPGYSNHQDGLALDLGTRKGKGGLIKLYKGSWFHNWMCANARTYQFEPLASEAWHWTYRPTAGASEAETWEFQSSTPFLSAENRASEVTPAAIRAGMLEVQKIPLLASHRGRAPDLILRWNEMPTVPAEIDVVVHLHGYSWATMTLPKHMEVWAGLDLTPVDGASGAGRLRPTLTVLPRGHFTGVKVGKIYRYTFPALTTKDGLTTLVRVAVEHFANQVGGTPKVGRLIMTAHSGGGAPLMQILRRHDPHEVHVFDGLYQDPSALAEWARRHITADRAAVQAGGAPSGAMRVFFGPGTRLFSTRLHNAMAAGLRAAPTSIVDRYRVESSRLGHWQIARQYGWRVLADAGADVPDAKRPSPTERSVKRLFEVDSAAVPSLPETPFPAEEFDLAEADETEAWEFDEAATEGKEEVDQLGGPEAEGEPWPAPELEDQEDEDAPGDLGSLEALGDAAELGSETESGPGRWGSFAEADMKPSIALKTVESPLYQGNALENAWQQISPELIDDSVGDLETATEAENPTVDFLDVSELLETGYEGEPHTQEDGHHSNETEHTADDEAEDAVFEGGASVDTEGHGDESQLFEELVPLTLPAATPKLPSDAAMRSQLQAMGTAAARALDLAFASFGDLGKFANRLPPALNAVYKPLGGLPEQHIVHVARLGAESFIYDAPRLEGDRYYPWVDYPDINRAWESPKLLASFLHFAMRRLHQISRIATRPETHRRQMDRASALFRFFHTELAREHRQTGIAESLLLDYRTMLVQIIWLHYQRLLDGWLATAAKSRLPDAVAGTEWVNILRMAAVTQVDDARALVPIFNMTPTLYRDYFDQNAASDIGYRHYTTTPPPFTGHGLQMSFATVLRRRMEQKALIEDLRKESGSAPIPKLHDSASWQAWARNRWDKPELRRESKLAFTLDFVGRYFNAFTIHAPLDLREGCSEKNYLTREFPRAVTGSLVHDCFVYACRWIHILGRLLTVGSPSEGIAKPRIFLIEMPAHVGVMIRGETTFNRHVLVSINNKEAQVHNISAGETDEAGAQIVVQHMYHGMKTPYVLRRLTSNPADAKSLWNEVCKLADRELVLPYKDLKDPPHLRYLKHNALVARIGREFTDAVRASWATLRKGVDRVKTGGGQASADLVRNEIRKHTARFGTAIKSAMEKIDSETKPLIKEINTDLDTHTSRIPKGTLILETAPKALFVDEVVAYWRALENAARTGDVLAINPELFFPDADAVLDPSALTMP